MKTGHLVKLAAIAAIVSVIAIAAYYQKNQFGPRGREGAVLPGSALLPRLLEKAEEITEITFADKDEMIRLLRDDRGGWEIVTSGNYPVSQRKVQQLVVELSDLKAADVLTDREDRYASFGLEDETGARGTLRLLGKDGREIASLTLGSERDASVDSDGLRRAGGRYVRIGKDPHVYLVQENLHNWLDSRAKNWGDTELLSVPYSDVIEAAIDHASTESLRLVFREGKLQLEDLDEGMEEKPYEASAVAGALNWRGFEDVLAADSDEARALEYRTTYTAKSKKGTIYTAKIAEKDGRSYVALSAVYDAPFFTDSDKATTDTLAAAQAAAEEAEKAVPEFNEKHGPWVYELPEWTVQNLVKKRSEMIEPKREPEVETEIETE